MPGTVLGTENERRKKDKSDFVKQPLRICRKVHCKAHVSFLNPNEECRELLIF